MEATRLITAGVSIIFPRRITFSISGFSAKPNHSVIPAPYQVRDKLQRVSGISTMRVQDFKRGVSLLKYKSA